jgi:hypothetical protein
MNASQQIGVVLLVISAALGAWTYNRFSSLVGQLHSWSPPFDGYEVTTICGGLAAVVCLLVGLRKVRAKPKGEA